MPIDRQRNQVLFRRLSRLLKQAADRPQAKTVHQLRTVTRRIEALLHVLDPDPGKNERRLLKRLAVVRRKAGRVRDVDVQTALLRGVEIGRDGHDKRRLLQVLEDLRGQREKKLVSALDRDTIREVRQRLRKTAQKLSLFQEPPSMAGALDVAHPFDPVATALREFSRIARAHGELREENLHDYRLETKHVRYVAEMAGKDETARGMVAELKRMQDAIGEWHDWLELTRRAEKALELAPEAPLLAALKNVTRAKFRDALSVCTVVRKHLLEQANTTVPPRKSVAGVRSGANTAIA